MFRAVLKIEELSEVHMHAASFIYYCLLLAKQKSSLILHAINLVFKFAQNMSIQKIILSASIRGEIIPADFRVLRLCVVTHAIGHLDIIFIW